MQRSEPDVISVVYSGDIDATKEQIVAKVKVRTDLRCALLLLTLTSRKGAVRHYARSGLPAFCLPQIKAARRGQCVATVYPPRPEPRFYVPCVGGHVEVCPRPLHR